MAAKICIGGPAGAGKSWLVSNVFDDTASSTGTREPRPTAGLRIVDIEAIFGDDPIQVWDCSGDKQYGHLWPAMAKGLHGAILVFDVDRAEEQMSELEQWFQYFVRDMKLKTNQVLLIANKTSFFDQPAPEVQLTNKAMTKARLVVANAQNEPEDVREAFIEFVKRVKRAMQEQSDKQAREILSD